MILSNVSETIVLERGSVSLSNGYCVSIQLRKPIKPKDIKREELYWSKELGYPVVFLTQIDDINWHVFHRDSVLLANYIDNQYLDRRNIWDILTNSDLWGIQITVVGLWNGQDIDELYNLFQNCTPTEFSYEWVRYTQLYALQSRSLSEKECKSNRIGVKTLNSKTYFIDKKGNGLIAPIEREVATVYETGKQVRFPKDVLIKTQGIKNTYFSLLMFTKPSNTSRYAKFTIDENFLENITVLSPNNKLIIAEHQNSERPLITELTEMQHRNLYRAFKSLYEFSDAVMAIGTTPVVVQEETLVRFSEGDLTVTEKDYGYHFPKYLELTTQGRSKSMKRLTPRLKRKAINRLLELVLERAAEIEKLEHINVKVSRIVVFGSYLDEQKQDFGDLDCVIELETKQRGYKPDFDDEWEKAHRTYELAYDAFEDGLVKYRPPQVDYVGMLMYPEIICMKHLKQSNHVLSCQHSPSELLALNPQMPILVVWENGTKVKPVQSTPDEIWSAKTT